MSVNSIKWRSTTFGTVGFYYSPTVHLFITIESCFFTFKELIHSSFWTVMESNCKKEKCSEMSSVAYIMKHIFNFQTKWKGLTVQGNLGSQKSDWRQGMLKKQKQQESRNPDQIVLILHLPQCFSIESFCHIHQGGHIFFLSVCLFFLQDSAKTSELIPITLGGRMGNHVWMQTRDPGSFFTFSNIVRSGVFPTFSPFSQRMGCVCYVVQSDCI